MSTHAEFSNRIKNVSHRYDTPPVSTWDFVKAIKEVIGPGFNNRAACNLLDVIKEIVPNPSLDQVKAVALLLGEDLEVDQIRQKLLEDKP